MINSLFKDYQNMKKRNKTSSSIINTIKTPTQSKQSRNTDKRLEGISSKGSEALHNHSYFHNASKNNNTTGRKVNLLATGRLYDNNSLQVKRDQVNSYQTNGNSFGLSTTASQFPYNQYQHNEVSLPQINRAQNQQQSLGTFKSPTIQFQLKKQKILSAQHSGSPAPASPQNSMYMRSPPDHRSVNVQRNQGGQRQTQPQHGHPDQ